MSQVARGFTESVVEQAALALLESLGYAVLAGPEIAPGEPQAERGGYRQAVLERRLRQALERLNPQFSSDALEEAHRKLTRPESPSLVANNRVVDKYLAKLARDESEKPKLDEEFEELTEGEAVEHQERLKTKWAQLEALAGTEKRIAVIEQDLVDHLERRRGRWKARRWWSACAG